MKRLPLLLIVVGPIVAVTVGILIVRTRTGRDTQPIAAGEFRGANVLLVTIDTLRADHVGAYGQTGSLTPTIDGLAKDGLRFARTYAHVPMTLPSHASLLTGAYPTRTGVRDNGAFRLDDRWDAIATVLKEAGYRTGAFVGAFVLDARFGLDHGFDTYDDRMLGRGMDEVAERPAEKVLEPAYQWICQAGACGPREHSESSSGAGRASGGGVPASSEKWFAWVHLYDPHEPYAPPEPYRSQYSNEPYDGEIAYADAALGAFLGRLRSAGALANTLVVVASDHGESLGEHGERTHGLFAYDSTLRVPLVMWAAHGIRAGVFPDPMRLVDVTPTILDFVGARAIAAADGRSVRPFIAGERPFDDPASYFEALNASLTRDWAPLTGIVYGGAKLVDLPVPELYDLAADPAEASNVYARQQPRARDLEARLDRIAKQASPVAPASIDADAEARLRSLGYVVASGPKPARTYTAADDPKQLVHLNAALDEAAAMFGRGDRDHAIETLRQVVRERPSMTIAYDRLAFMLRSTGRAAEAVTVLDEAARAGRSDRALLRSLGAALGDAGELKRSASVLEPLVRADATDLQSADTLGQTYARLGRGSEAEALFKRVLASSPNASSTWNNLGATYLTAGRVDDAIDALSKALAIDPELATAHNGLGVAYARRGEMDRAAAEWRRALELRPDYADARDNLGKLERTRR
jgi:arylsulfatase A-like enzyme/Flp pilus assembly protein TadD